MNLRKIVSRDHIFTDYVNILNGILRLSKREAEVFSLMLRFNEDTDSELLDFSYIRKVIVEVLGISEANLSRYLGTLKNRKLLVLDNAKWVINDNIKPILDNDLIEVTFTLEINEDVKKDIDSVEDFNKVESDMVE